MKKIISYCIICMLGMMTISCSKDKLKIFETSDKIIEFQLSSRFSKDENSPKFNFFHYGKYRIEIDVFHKSNEIVRNQFAEFYSGKRTTHRNMLYSMTFNKTETPVENENGYHIIAFYGTGGDASALLPTHHEGFSYFVETPSHIVKILLKHTARRTNAMDKTEAQNYIKPLLKSLKEKGNLIYSPVIEPIKIEQ